MGPYGCVHILDSNTSTVTSYPMRLRLAIRLRCLNKAFFNSLAYNPELKQFSKQTNLNNVCTNRSSGDNLIDDELNFATSPSRLYRLWSPIQIWYSARHAPCLRFAVLTVFLNRQIF